MSFKEYFKKKVIPTYFMIVTFILFAMAALGLAFYRSEKIDVLTLFVPLGFGAIGCLPLLADYVFSRRKSTPSGLLLYNLAELLLLEVCILTAAWLVGILDSMLTVLIVAAMVMCIFAAVGTIMYIQDRNFCDSVNDALANYSENNAN